MGAQQAKPSITTTSSAADMEQFAIRPTLRNHNILSRDSVIRQVASLVGPGHQVDLKNYELLVVVEVYQVSTAEVSLTIRH